METTGCERNWADLHPELLGMISDKLVLLPDYIRMGAVCKQWLSVIHEGQRKRHLNCFNEPPLLLIPTEDGSRDYRCLYSIWEQKVYPHRLPIPYSTRCCGSSFGWWAVAEKDMSITLLDPFSGGIIHLPPVMVIPHYYIDFYHGDLPAPESLIHKVVLSCDPSLHPKDWVVAALHNYKRLAFIRSGEGSWSYLSMSYLSMPFSLVQDACFYRGRLYAVDIEHALIAIDVSHTEGYFKEHLDDWGRRLEKNSSDVWRVGDRVATKVESLIGSSRHLGYSWMVYLVEFEGDLLLARRLYFHDGDNFNFQVTVGFKVYKLSYKQRFSYDSEKAAEWVEIQSLNNFSLFVGDNTSICVSASSFPNCQPNCIFYMDDSQEMDEYEDDDSQEMDEYEDDDSQEMDEYEADDMGIFNLTNGQISKYYILEPSKRYMPHVVWISPKMGKLSASSSV